MKESCLLFVFFCVVLFGVGGDAKNLTKVARNQDCRGGMIFFFFFIFFLSLLNFSSYYYSPSDYYKNYYGNHIQPWKLFICPQMV